ncbi:dawdle [Carabus blaptoides fortunei]
MCVWYSVHPKAGTPCVNSAPRSSMYIQLMHEYIKNQILKKLRLKEKPSVALPIAGLPKPVTEDENLFPRSQDDSSSEYSDDYYGKTTQAIIFPHEDKIKCPRKKRNPSACLPFQIPADLHPSDVSMAELWVYKKLDILDSHNQTFLISEVAHWDSKRSFQKTKPIAMKETHIGEGWIKINIAWAVKNWIEYSETNHVLSVACKTCGMDIHASPIELDKDLKPFLVIYTYSQSRRRPQRRIKRNLNCVPGMNECCRESLYVSFKDIGWNDWILHPPGYNAFFCRGSCTATASVTLSASYHNTIMQKMMYGSNRKLELVPCCAPTHYQKLELLFLKDNKTLTTQMLPNMVVDTCGCM